ncbi:MAG TPA: GNAT family N-acetyltransferase [Novosphingobium sp.]
MIAGDRRFRKGTAADVPAIRALLESAYRGDSARQGWTHESDLLSGDRTSEAEVAGIVAAPHQRIIVVEERARVIGCVAITDLGSGKAYLGMLAVSPALQAGGLGRALIAAAEDEARRTFAARSMEMTVIGLRPELIAWYQRRGYQPTGEIRPFHYDAPERAGIALVVLERQIA